MRLRLASILASDRNLLPELRNVDRLTTSALEAMIIKHAPEQLKNVGQRDYDYTSMEEGRRRMVESHNQMINVLIQSMGREKAIEMGRKMMYHIGLSIGQEMRGRLRVRDNLGDLERAARLLYRVLGIEFEIEKEGQEIRMVVHRCSLASSYTSESCRIMSAADEGVVNGLCPSIKMRFMERITENRSRCVADLRVEGR